MLDEPEPVSVAGIPVFASVPSKLDEAQRASQRHVYGRLAAYGLQPRTVGAAEQAIYYNPLHEVRTLARHCAGGIVLGYAQVSARRAFKQTEGKPTIITEYQAPTPWNHLETGILFGLGLPLFVLKQDRIDGGIFDAGASDVLVHPMPMPVHQPSARQDEYTLDTAASQSFESALLRWQALVRSRYYGDA